MDALLRAHEEDIVNQVVQRLHQNNRQAVEPLLQPREQQLHQPRLPLPANPTMAGIALLEDQLAELRAERELVVHTGLGTREVGPYNLISPKTKRQLRAHLP